MKMTQGITINGIHTYEEFGVYISERTVTPGKKREVKAEVPYMNGAYDFSAMNGEPTYGEAELKYVFDIAGEDTESMEALKKKILTWFYLAVDSRIEDDYCPDYYYTGTASAAEWEEDFGEGHLTLKFLVYPYKTAKEATLVKLRKSDKSFECTSSHMTDFSLTASEAMEFKLNGETYSLEKGTFDTDGIKLLPGTNTVTVYSQNGYVTVKYTEEAFC